MVLVARSFEVPVPDELAQPVGGVKRTVNVQLVPPDRVFPEQLSDAMMKGEASGFADAMDPITRLPPAVFAIVTVWSTDLPSRTLPNGICRSSMGFTESVTLIRPTVADEPVPLTDTVTEGFAVSLFGMLKLSVKVPVAVGANEIVRVQDADGAMVWFEHVSAVTEKGAASESVAPTVPITRPAFPLFVTVTVCVADVPAVMLPNGTSKSVVGATESVTEMAAVGTAAPVPLTFMVTELFAGSLLGMLKLSLKVPVAVGANAIVRVQDADGAMV